MQDTIEIKIEITFDDEYGKVYVATNDELGLVTDGRTFEELLKRLREALEICLEDATEVHEPRIILTLEMPSDAQTA